MRGQTVFVVLCIASAASFAIVVASLDNLGFSLVAGLPFLLMSVGVVALSYSIPRTRSLNDWSSPSKVLVLMTALGASLRIAMLFNSSAQLDEWTNFVVVAHTNMLDVVSFVKNFNQISGIPWTETTPLPYLMMKFGYLISPTLQGIRIIPTIMNVGLVPTSYYLSLEFASERTARITTLLFAINPGAIFFFDTADTDVFLAFFAILGLLFLVRGFKRGSKSSIALSGLLFSLAFWSKTSLPYVWLGIGLIFGLFVIKASPRYKKILGASLVVIIAFGGFLPWAAADPQSFNESIISVPVSIVQQFFNPTGINLGGPTLGTTTQGTTTQITTTRGTTTQAAEGVPLGWYTPFVNVVEQIPLWFGPVALLLGILFLGYAILRNIGRRTHVWMLLWALAILVPLLTLNRDIRYFMDVATFPVIFLCAEAVTSDWTRFSRQLEVLAVLMGAVFLIVGCTVGYQLNSGIAESAQFVNQNLPNTSVMVTPVFPWGILTSSDNVSVLPTNISSFNSTLIMYGPNVFVDWNQARTFTLSQQQIGILESLYSNHVKFGASNFSYAMVFYGRK